MGAAAAVAGLALAAAGCGGSNDESDSGLGGTTTSTGTVSSAVDGCASLAKVEASFSAALLKTTSGKSIRVAAASKAFGAMADQVPDELSDDFEALATAFAAYAEALEGITVKAGTAPTAAQIKQLAKAAKALDEKAVNTASSNIETWIEENCR